MPQRHLEPARIVCEASGTVTLPAGGPGDLDDTAPGTTVLVIATEDEGAVPAATWRAVFEGRVPHAPGDPWPPGLPSTWTEEHLADAAPAAQPPGDDDEDDEDEPDERAGPQSFFRVRTLEPIPRAEWLFANELVPKQERRGRTFVPRTPRSIRFVD